MHDKHVMIDIETLSTENDAAIIAIGAVEFDLDNILQERIWRINPMLSSGRRDPDTIDWWWKQDEQVRTNVFSGSTPQNVVAGELFNWSVLFRENHWIWAGPSTFDLSIIKTWYRNQGMIYPFNWRNERDLTTISRISNSLGIDYSVDSSDYIPHDPLSDAINQARRCQIILKRLDRAFDPSEDVTFYRKGP